MADEYSDAEIEEHLAVIDAATPGPWEPAHNVTNEDRAQTVEEMVGLVRERIQESGGEHFYIVTAGDSPHGGPLIAAETGNGPTSVENAAFIALARTHWPRALRRLLQLSSVEAECVELRADRQRKLDFDIRLVELIGPHLGETGKSESLVECLERIIAERNELRALHVEATGGFTKEQWAEIEKEEKEST